MSIRHDKIRWLRLRLLDFFKRAGREHLPWRRRGVSAYEVWVSEVMLQQTQVSRVIGYYERFLKRFPAVKHLAKASWEEFLPYYSGLGYYARGRNMLATAKRVVKEYNGNFPRDISELEKLPGIGPYTARAISSFAYGNTHLAWDTNLERVLGRFFRGGKSLLTKEERGVIEQILSPKAQKLNAALMDFGSSLCLARPKCAACMLKERCTYFRERGKRERRDKKKTHESSHHAPTKGERVILFLHERHRLYYSSSKENFAPFLLPRGIITRSAIKEYFKKQYGLELSVRPPHRKTKKRGIRSLLINAQILLGKPDFLVFPKAAVLEYTRDTKSF